MKKERKQFLKSFFRSFYISLFSAGCILAGIFGAARAYEKTVLLGFGMERHAFELYDGGLRIFDFEIPLKQTD